MSEQDFKLLQMELRAVNAEAECASLQAQLLRFRFDELNQRARQIQAQMRPAESTTAAPAQSPTADPQPDEEMHADLARIAKAGMPVDVPAVKASAAG